MAIWTCRCRKFRYITKLLSKSVPNARSSLLVHLMLTIMCTHTGNERLHTCASMPLVSAGAVCTQASREPNIVQEILRLPQLQRKQFYNKLARHSHQSSRLEFVAHYDIRVSSTSLANPCS